VTPEGALGLLRRKIGAGAREAAVHRGPWPSCRPRPFLPTLSSFVKALSAPATA